MYATNFDRSSQMCITSEGLAAEPPFPWILIVHVWGVNVTIPTRLSLSRPHAPTILSTTFAMDLPSDEINDELAHC